MLDTDDHVLVVDDVKDVRDGIKSLLEDEGFSVYIAENGFGALEVLTKNKISLVISDILMPEMDGIEMCAKIKERFPDMMFILISGGGRQASSLSSGYDYLNAMTKLYGVDAVLKKPFNPEDLVNLVKSKFENLQ
jgi:CheY-like chemotaxis protein